MFQTYGLIDPTSGNVFYVGQTGNLINRIKAHSHCDPASATYFKVISLRDQGIRFQVCVFGTFETRLEAKRLERALVNLLPDLVNSSNSGALLNELKYPSGEIDEIMASAALNPHPPAQPYGSFLRVSSDIPPMVHRPGAYAPYSAVPS